MRFAPALILAIAGLTTAATFNCDASRNCCMKNHAACRTEREGGITACDEPDSVYCGNCGANCCTYDPSYPIYDDADGSVWTSSPNVYGTYCKS